MSEPLRIGTRASRLALWQARHVRDLLLEAHPGLEVEIVHVKTTGDRLPSRPLAGAGAVGLFTKEIERALLDRRVDVAVHSLKDLPVELAPGLALAAVPERADVRDALVGRVGLGDLGPGVVVGTGSPRRSGQLRARFPGVRVVPVRGNVPTRIGLAGEPGGPDAVILALAGLSRLGLADRIAGVLPPEIMLPAPGQGALGIETREDDAPSRGLVGVLDVAPVRAAVRAERAFLRRLQGGCTVPAGALGEVGEEGLLRLRGVVTDLEGREVFSDEAEGTPDRAVALGEALAERLLAAGADRVLRALREGP